jgi:hypothetical protein
MQKPGKPQKPDRTTEIRQSSFPRKRVPREAARTTETRQPSFPREAETRQRVPRESATGAETRQSGFGKDIGTLESLIMDAEVERTSDLEETFALAKKMI